MKKYKYNYDENFETMYDNDTYNEYEGYNQQYDEFADSFDEDAYKQCEVCGTDYLAGYEDNDLCYSCETEIYKSEAVYTEEATDANEILQDEFYFENNVMENKIQYEGNVSPDSIYIKKNK